MIYNDKINHKPVLKEKILEFIQGYSTIPVLCDCTIGEGGYIDFFKNFLNNWKFIGCDRDQNILRITKNRLENLNDNLLLINDSYANIRKYYKENIGVFILDLGLSMYHLKQANRGFSYKNINDKLDMRFSQKTEKTAAFILNNYDFDRLKYIFEQYGDIKNAENIIQNIIKYRKKQSFVYVKDLLNCINIKSNHFLSRLFQALRIETNDELKELELFLSQFFSITNQGSLVIFLAYHSGEDKLIKNNLKHWQLENKIEVLTKHVIKPDYREIKQNKAARSAKMRVIRAL